MYVKPQAFLACGFYVYMYIPGENYAVTVCSLRTRISFL